jgi:hypothetical protein
VIRMKALVRGAGARWTCSRRPGARARRRARRTAGPTSCDGRAAKCTCLAMISGSMYGCPSHVYADCCDCGCPPDGGRARGPFPRDTESRTAWALDGATRSSVVASMAQSHGPSGRTLRPHRRPPRRSTQRRSAITASAARAKGDLDGVEQIRRSRNRKVLDV